MRRIWLGLALCLLAAAPAQAAETKYSIANGCFEVGGQPVRFKATTLAEYLLYTQDGKYIAAGGERGRRAEPEHRVGGDRRRRAGHAEAEGGRRAA